MMTTIRSAGLTTSQMAAQRNLDQYLAKKAQDMLEKVLGPGQAIVRVSAEINFDTLTRTEEKFDPDGQVIRTQTKDDENNDHHQLPAPRRPWASPPTPPPSTNSVRTGSVAGQQHPTTTRPPPPSNTKSAKPSAT